VIIVVITELNCSLFIDQIVLIRQAHDTFYRDFSNCSSSIHIWLWIWKRNNWASILHSTFLLWFREPATELHLLSYLL